MMTTFPEYDSLFHTSFVWLPEEAKAVSAEAKLYDTANTHSREERRSLARQAYGRARDLDLAGVAGWVADFRAVAWFVASLNYQPLWRAFNLVRHSWETDPEQLQLSYDEEQGVVDIAWRFSEAENIEGRITVTIL